jgi:hypothetical protein
MEKEKDNEEELKKLKEKLLDRNLGVCWERAIFKFNLSTPRVNPELIFQEQWNKENSECPGFNRGLGTAQELFCVSDRSAELFTGPDRDDKAFYSSTFEKETMIYDLTVREHKIIATIIQWLGTPCGFGFLQNCLKLCGYSLVPIQEKIKEPIKPKQVNEKMFRMFSLWKKKGLS